ncbi:MAG: Formamidopyrimidine-DNA glycosylase [Microgenomates group bacterium Gr01-1014_7]|nr:MAG: Formamidopyrimidine-DNA glycosylase [Microgenomates group bacterium Gr01-1014_7]
MPELPEVETIKLGLQKKIIGLKIKEIEIISPKSFIGNAKLVKGKKVLNIWRKAKILGVELDGSVILFHLKMTGQLIFDPSTSLRASKRLIGGHPTQDMVGPLPNKSTRVILQFSDGSKMYFNDQRRFGWIKVVESSKLKVQSFLKNLGPEPLEERFSWQILKQNLLKHKSQPVKVTLMDQKLISGVGNIYANEACFNAKLDPRKKVSSLSDEEFRTLHRGVVKALRDGIKYGGSTRAHFVDSEGHKGYFLDYAYVYWKNSHPCKICGTEIKKVQLGGRGTYFCPNCQA